MFTGIVESGEVVKVAANELWVSSAIVGDCAIGSSVAINGVCLTVTEKAGTTVRFDVVDESLARSTLGSLAAGDRVNVERPVRAGEELGGHVVQGHVDGVGTVVSRARDGDGRRVRIEVGELTRYIVEKGSVTVDGVSLTVSDVDEDSFEVALIPHTLAITTLATAKNVNIEVDVLAKYVEKLAGADRAATRTGG